MSLFRMLLLGTLSYRLRNRCSTPNMIAASCETSFGLIPRRRQVSWAFQMHGNRASLDRIEANER